MCLCFFQFCTYFPSLDDNDDDGENGNDNDGSKQGWMIMRVHRPADRSPPAQVSAAACFELRASRRCKHACDAEKMLKLILMMMGWGKPVVGVFHGFP